MMICLAWEPIERTPLRPGSRCPPSGSPWSPPCQMTRSSPAAPSPRAPRPRPAPHTPSPPACSPSCSPKRSVSNLQTASLSRSPTPWGTRWSGRWACRRPGWRSRWPGAAASWGGTWWWWWRRWWRLSAPGILSDDTRELCEIRHWTGRSRVRLTSRHLIARAGMDGLQQSLYTVLYSSTDGQGQGPSVWGYCFLKPKMNNQ